MALQLFKIADVTVSSPQATVEFISIPQGYTDLKVVCSSRCTTTNTAFLFTFNSSTTGYSNKRLFSDGSTVYSDSSITTAISSTSNNASDYTANTFGNGEFYIPNYTSANFKSVNVDGVTENNATAALSMLTAGLWSNTAAITSITITPASGSISTNSTFTLYGVL
jgi:hypothetical protein